MMSAHPYPHRGILCAVPECPGYHGIFRQLAPAEEVTFRQWAHDNYEADVAPDPLWHPVVRDEWRRIAAGEVAP